MIVSFLLKNQEIRRTDSNTVVAQSRNYLRAKFSTLTDDWIGPITAIFNEYTVLLDDSHECVVPWEVLQNPGTVKVSAFCGDLHTASVATMAVNPSGYVDGETPEPPTPDVYEQLTGMVQNAIDTAQSVRDDANEGKFNGSPGEPGEPGPQGEPGPKGPAGLNAPQIDDTKITTANPWSSSKIVETVCPPFEVTGPIVTCNPVAGYPLHVVSQIVPVQEGEGDPSPENVRPISGYDSVTVTQSKDEDQVKQITLTLPETIYGGTVDAVTGVGMEEWEYMEFDGTEDWYKNGQDGYFLGNVIDIGPGGGRESKSNIAVNSAGQISPIPDGQFNTWSFTTSRGWVGFSLSFADSLDSWKSYLAAQAAAGTPVQVAYKLATPTAFQATGNQALPAVGGLNTIYTDTGDTTVSGRADPISIINQLAERIAALESAATNI